MIFLLLLLKFLPLLNETNENIYFVERISQYICAPSDEIMIYYFDGDCAFCIDKLNLYSEKYKDPDSSNNCNTNSLRKEA